MTIQLDPVLEVLIVVLLLLTAGELVKLCYLVLRLPSYYKKEAERLTRETGYKWSPRMAEDWWAGDYHGGYYE